MIERFGSPFAELWHALREAGTDARRAWNRNATVAAATLVVAAIVPLMVRDPVRLGALASALYTVLAAIGVNFAVGMAGIPSLGHGAFVAIGVFAVALLRTDAGWDPSVATLAAVTFAGVGGLVVGVGAIRLSRPIVAISTWVVSWLVAFALGAFPGFFGGLQGIAVPEGTLGIAALGITLPLTPAVHYEVALLLVGVALAGYAVLSRAPLGLALAAARDAPGPARALGVEEGRMRFRTFTASAMVCGLAGALSVQLAGIADATAYGPLLSVELFAAVLLGGVGRPLGPVFGAAGLLLIPLVAEGLGSLAGLSAERFEPAVASLLLIGALLIGRGGVLGWLALARDRLRAPRNRHSVTSAPLEPKIGGTEAATPATWKAVLTGPQSEAADGALLRATGLEKRFGGVVALENVELQIDSGEVRGLIGPNGSGKTTLLRVLGGTVEPDNGRIILGGGDLTDKPTTDRVRAGLVRTLQRIDVVPTLSVRENVVVGATARRRYGGGLRSLTLTPRARAEGKTVTEEAEALLAVVGLQHAADRYPRELSGTEQRFVMIAAACASFPRLLLLDEPSAGMSRLELERLLAVVRQLRSEGVAIVLVEHNLRLVRLLADRVTVLDAGRMIAEGSPEEISSNQAVIEAYLGPRGM